MDDAGRNPRFQTTHWSVVMAAGGGRSGEAKAALAELCERYWFPLYTFARRKTQDDHRAQDLLQAFFVELLENDVVAAADPAKGKFRTFLLTALSRFMIKRWDYENAAKRGGGWNRIPIDFGCAEQRYRGLKVQDQTPEQAFERQWALEILNRALSMLQQEYIAAGKAQLFTQLKSSLLFEEPRLPYSEIAKSLDLSEANVKTLIHRLRKRFRDILCQIIGETLSDPAGVDDEIAQLFQAFSRNC